MSLEAMAAPPWSVLAACSMLHQGILGVVLTHEDHRGHAPGKPSIAMVQISGPLWTMGAWGASLWPHRGTLLLQVADSLLQLLQAVFLVARQPAMNSLTLCTRRRMPVNSAALQLFLPVSALRCMICS